MGWMASIVYRGLANHRRLVDSLLVRSAWQQTRCASQKKLTISLVGRPNTGKSTLFNRLTGKKSAIVSNVPGTTRDRKEGNGMLAGQAFKVVDTGGLDERGMISADIQKQVKYALQNSHIVLFLVDTRAGITPLDEQFARWIRMNLGKNSTLASNAVPPKVVLAANKAEGGYVSSHVLNIVSDGNKLGFGEPLLLSAVHGDGFTDLATLLFQYAERYGYDSDGNKITPPVEPTTSPASSSSSSSSELEEATLEVLEEKTPAQRAMARVIQMAVMGRPNVGKSTLINAIVQEERVIAGPLPGLTRDSISIDWEYEGRRFQLVDTAGLTRISTNKALLEGVKEKRMYAINELVGKAAKNETIVLPGVQMVNCEEDPSQYSAQISELALLSALNSLRYAQVVMLVVEGSQQKFMKVDLQLARRCLEEGRGLFIVANKFDLVQETGLSLREYEAQVKAHCEEYLREFGDIPVIGTTGIEGEGLSRVLRTAIKVHDSWSRRISTYVLNTWLRDTLVSVPAARSGDKPVRIKYMTQVKARPPTFTLFANVAEIPGSFERFLRSRLQEDFHLRGVPLRFVVKKTTGNPAKLHLLRHGKHSKRGAGFGDSRGRVGPNRRKLQLLKKLKGSVLQRRKRDKRMKRRS